MKEFLRKHKFLIVLTLLLVILSILLVITLELKSKNERYENKISGLKAELEEKGSSIKNNNEIPFYLKKSEFNSDKYEWKFDEIPFVDKIMALDLVYEGYDEVWLTKNMLVGVQKRIGTRVWKYPFILDNLSYNIIDMEVMDIDNDSENELIVLYITEMPYNILQVYDIDYKNERLIRNDKMKIEVKGWSNIFIEDNKVFVEGDDIFNHRQYIQREEHLIKKDEFELISESYIINEEKDGFEKNIKKRNLEDYNSKLGRFYFKK